MNTPKKTTCYCVIGHSKQQPGTNWLTCACETKNIAKEFKDALTRRDKKDEWTFSVEQLPFYTKQ